MYDTIAPMNEGRFEQIGAPQELYEQPANMINHGERPGLFDDTSITRFSSS